MQKGTQITELEKKQYMSASRQSVEHNDVPGEFGPVISVEGKFQIPDKYFKDRNML